MLVATWNINSINARLGFVLHWLRARNPDVVCLQELKVTDEAFPHAALAELGYHAATSAEPQWNGVAVLARGDKPEIVDTELPGQREHGARFVTARTHGLRVTSVYVPNGKTVTHPDYPLKLGFLDALARHLAATKTDEPTIVGGDFNLTPADADSYNPVALAGAIFHTEAERSRYRALLDEARLVDLFRKARPDEQSFSWWDYRYGAFHKRMGLRIDLLLGNAPVAERTADVTIDRDYRKKKDGAIPSDHAPVIAELRD